MLTVGPVSSPPWMWVRLMNTGLVSKGMPVPSDIGRCLYYSLAGSNPKSVGKMEEGVLSHQKRRTQVLLYMPGLSSESFTHSFKHSLST